MSILWDKCEKEANAGEKKKLKKSESKENEPNNAK